MPNTVAAPVQPAADLITATVRRTPLYFDSQGQGLFAWLHHPEPRSALRHGVVLCPPLGYEQIHAHRSLRHLADGLARAGFSVLRFDYHGTGDSAGSEEDPDRLATWLANVRDAQAWLRQELGCTRISLAGLRLGALLATQAAAGRAVDNLLLWAPVVKGRAYAREMKALALTAGGKTPPGGDVEAAGFVLTEQTLRDLAGVDLLTSRPLCRRALILTRDDLPDDPRLLDHFRALGIDVEQSSHPGYADMMAEPHYTRVPHQAIAHAVGWLRSAAAGPDGIDEDAAPVELLIPPGQSLRHASGPSARVTERMLHVSRQPDLFGILSEPEESPAPDLPCVVLLNAGSAYRAGPNRLHVFLARHLAGRGFRCLRLDLCGLGDSITDDAARENDPYPATAFRDIHLTLDHLHRHLGIRQVVLMGLCSGAYAAFQAAAQLAGPVLVESVLINPLTFYWREGMTLEASPTAPLQSFHDGMASAWQPRKWLKLLTGRSKLGIAGAVKMVLARWRLRGRSCTSVPDAPGSTKPDTYPSHPVRNDLPGDLSRAVEAGRHITCILSRSDPGYRILTFYAGRPVKKLCRAGLMSVAFIEDADHTFSRRAWREALGEAIAAHLEGRYASAACDANSGSRQRAVLAGGEPG